MFKLCCGTVLAFAPVVGVHAGDTVTWTFDQSTTGNDVFWTSPTAVSPGADSYDYSYEITSVKVDVKWSIFTFNNVDVTDEIDPKLLMSSGSISGPLPITIFDDTFVYPEPPEEPGVAADVHVFVDGSGFGQLEVTDVILGQVDYDLGPPFGTQTVTVLKIAIAGTIDITSVDLALFGDFDGDGDVDGADLGILLSAWGTDDDATDLNDDGTVDGADLGQFLVAWTG
jgi:hypothetical protein